MCMYISKHARLVTYALFRPSDVYTSGACTKSVWYIDKYFKVIVTILLLLCHIRDVVWYVAARSTDCRHTSPNAHAGNVSGAYTRYEPYIICAQFLITFLRLSFGYIAGVWCTYTLVITMCARDVLITLS